MLTIDVITLFPEVIAPFTTASIPGRAAAAGLVKFNLVQLRDFTHDRHNTVDDYAYGGGAGMVLKPEPFFEAVESLGETEAIVLLSARGRRFGHDDAVRLSLDDGSRCSAATTRTWTSGWRTGSPPRSCRSAISCSPGASPPRSACSTRWCGSSPARWRPRERQRRFALRRAVEPAELYPAAGLSRPRGARSASVGRPRADRGVAAGGGGAADARAAAGFVGTIVTSRKRGSRGAGRRGGFDDAAIGRGGP